jgi:hypothetical protein
MPGTDLVRRYQGKDVVVRVREDGFEFCIAVMSSNVVHAVGALKQR